MPSQIIILYDIPSKDRTCWSANVWKVRLALNYKQIPYTTQWIELPDIEPTFKALNIPPNPQASWSSYSVPTIQIPSGEFIMNTDNILPHLETLRPSPPLHLEKSAELLSQAGSEHNQAIGRLMPYFMPLIRRHILGPGRSADWFKADREKRFGLPEERWEAEYGGEKAWRAARKGLEEMRDLVRGNKVDEGPFVLGSTPIYVDFVVAGLIDMFRCIGSEAYEKLVGWDEEGVLRDLYEGCAPWLEKRD